MEYYAAEIELNAKFNMFAQNSSRVHTGHNTVQQQLKHRTKMKRGQYQNALGVLTIHNFGPTSFFPRYLIYRVMTKSVNLTKLVRLRTTSLTINRLDCPCVIFQDKQSFLLDLISVELMRNVTMSLCVYLLSCLLPF